MDYRKLLEYYLTSDEWELQVDSFFEEWRHCYDPYEDRYESEHGKIYLYSTIYNDYKKRLNDGGGTYFGLYLTPSQFERFFDVRYSDDHRFAVLFGMWWGLTEKQLHALALLRNKRCCLQLLNFFLCNPEVTKQPITAELNDFAYAGKYVAEIFEDRSRPSARSSRIIPVTEILPDGSFLLETD